MEHIVYTERDVKFLQEMGYLNPSPIKGTKLFWVSVLGQEDKRIQIIY